MEHPETLEAWMNQYPVVLLSLCLTSQSVQKRTMGAS